MRNSNVTSSKWPLFPKMHIYRTSTCHPLPAIFSSPSPIVVYDQHPLSRLSVASVRKASPVTTPAPLTRKIVWFRRVDVSVCLVCRGPVAVGRRPCWRVVSSLPSYLALVDNIVAVSGAHHGGGAHYVEVSPRSSVTSATHSDYVIHEREVRRERRDYSPARSSAYGDRSPTYETYRYIDPPEPRYLPRERSRSRDRRSFADGSYRETRERVLIVDDDGRRRREYRR